MAKKPLVVLVRWTEVHVPNPGMVHIVDHDDDASDGSSRGPTRANSPAYREGWERIFGQKKNTGGKPN